MISREDIQKLAMLSRINLSEEEEGKLTKDLEGIVNYISELKEAKVTLTEGSKSILRNVLRDDNAPHEVGKYSEDILANTKEKKGGYISVKKIL